MTLTMEQPTTTAQPPRNLLLRQAGYCFAQFPLAIASFVIVVTLVPMGVGMLITLVGLPILFGAAYAARGIAITDRALVRSLLAREAPEPKYKRSSDGFVKRVLAQLSDPQTWLDIGYILLRFPLAMVSFPILLSWVCSVLAGLTYPLWGWALSGTGYQGPAYALGLGNSYLMNSVVFVIIGLFCLATLPWVVRGLAYAHSSLAVLMLSSRAGLQHELASVSQGRAASRQAQAGALRRLERDIHDGPQQQLVRLSMDLGRARRQVDLDPNSAKDILDEAIARSTSTLDELRALSRGIAPPILVDRGLEAAVRELIGRAPVPIHLQYNVDRELPEHVELTAYFVVSEALTNLAKHAQASLGSVLVAIEPPLGNVSGMRGADELRVVVTDDGIGGAHLGKGAGLAGLADRLRAVDGVIEVLSPTGGPTTIEARMPCE